MFLKIPKEKLIPKNQFDEKEAYYFEHPELYLGEGASGLVYRCLYGLNEFDYCVKIKTNSNYKDPKEIFKQKCL